MSNNLINVVEIFGYGVQNYSCSRGAKYAWAKNSLSFLKHAIAKKDSSEKSYKFYLNYLVFILSFLKHKLPGTILFCLFKTPIILSFAILTALVFNS